MVGEGVGCPQVTKESTGTRHIYVRSRVVRVDAAFWKQPSKGETFRFLKPIGTRYVSIQSLCTFSLNISLFLQDMKCVGMQ